MDEKLRSLRLKKAMLLEQMEMLSSISPEAYTKLGKLEFEIIQLEKEINRNANNILDEN